MGKIYNLTEGSILKKLLTVAIPVLLTSISQMAYNLTDIFWMGRVDNFGLNEQYAITAVGTAGMIVWFSMGLILIARIGTSVRISHVAGVHDESAISLYASNGLILQFFMGILFSLGALIFRNQFISIFNMSNSIVIGYAVTYTAIVGSGLIFQFMSSGFASINEGLGKTRTNLYILLVGLVLNMILDPLLILVFQLGVSGAAIATVTAQAVTLSVFIIYYYKKNQKLHAFSFKALNFKAIINIISIGFPTGIQSVLFTSISIYITRIILQYGEATMAAQRIGVQIEQFTWMIASGFQTALTVFVGQNYGANKPDRIQKGMVLISKILLPYALFIALMLFLFPENIMRIFVNDPDTIYFGTRYLRIISVAQIFMMAEAIGTGLFNGVGLTWIPSTSGVVNNFVRIPLALLLIKTLNQEGIWWALNISAMIKGFIMIVGSILLLKNIEKVLTRLKVKRKTVEVTG